VRLNLGCGETYIDGWVNVDHQSPFPADERVDLTGPLPWPAGSITHVYAGHVLEHLTHDQCADLAKRLLDCMNADGVLIAVGPDIDAAIRLSGGTNRVGKHSLEVIRHGGHRWPGDVHLWETTAANVTDLLAEAGWVVDDIGITNIDAEWPVARRDPWQYGVQARKASTWQPS
jgi:predicted SAM-dependent methyltransferase